MSIPDTKTDENITCILEKCSLLVDGEFNEEEVDEFLSLYAESEDIGGHVQTYHLIGDVLRSADFAASHVALGSRFNMGDFRKKLAQEPLILAPVSLPRKTERKRRFVLEWPHWAGMAAASVAIVAIAGVLNIPQEMTLPTAPQSMAGTAAVGALQESFAVPIQKVRGLNQVGATALNTVSQENSRVSPAFYMAAHHQFGYDSIVNRSYTRGQTVQTTASK